MGTYATGQQLLHRGARDVGEVLHKVAGSLEDSQNLLVSAGHKLEAADQSQALHVVAVDLRPRDFMPGQLKEGVG